MIETLVTNRGLLFNPSYGRVGTVVLPMFTVAEAIGPLIEGSATSLFRSRGTSAS
jgi:hypothetical protein